MAVLGNNIWGPGPSSFGRQKWLSEITIEPIKNLGPGQDLGGGLYPSLKPPLLTMYGMTDCQTVHMSRTFFTF